MSYFSSHFFSQLDCMFKSGPAKHSRAHMVLGENQLIMFSRGGAASLASTESSNRDFNLIFPKKHSLCLLLCATAAGCKYGTFGLVPPEETIR